MTKRILILAHDQARKNAVQAVLEAPEGYSVTIKEPSRNLDQNAKFHALCSSLADSPLAWAGKRRSANEWKALLISGHAVATKEDGEIIKGLEGELVAIRESSAKMSKQRASSLIEYSIAFTQQYYVDTE